MGLKLNTQVSPDSPDCISGVGEEKQELECDMLALCLPQACVYTN